MTPVMPRVEDIILPLLRSALPGVTVGTWVEDIDHRSFPLVHLHHIGGVRHDRRPKQLAMPEVQMACMRSDNLANTTIMYNTALEALYDAWLNQTVTPAGYLSSFVETTGMRQGPSPYQDSWFVSGTMKFGVRPLHTKLSRSI